jgi:hypothetical protein
VKADFDRGRRTTGADDAALMRCNNKSGDDSVTKIIRIFLLGTMLLGSALFATAADQVRVNVPFDFSVNGKTLKAGTYTISRAEDSTPSMMVIQSANGQPQSVFFATALTSLQTGSTLSFHHYGDSYFLTHITNASGKYSLPLTHTERMAMNQPGNDMVVGSK